MAGTTVINQTVSCWYILWLMFIAGFLGGITNYFRTWKDDNDRIAFWKNVLMGVSASLLIPLFLNMISSGLIEESMADPTKLYVLFGFCLIAALSSKAFIQSMSDRILNEMNKVKERTGEVEKQIEPIVLKESETERDDGEEIHPSGIRVRGFSFDDNAKKILKALQSERYSWRTVSGLAKDTKIAKPEVVESIQWLHSNRLVVTIKNDRGINLWGLTAEGKDVSDNLKKAEQSYATKTKNGISTTSKTDPHTGTKSTDSIELE